MSAGADREGSDEPVRDRAHRRRERRRLAVALVSTALAVPLLLVEVAGGADASPDPQPAVYSTDLVEPAPVDPEVDDDVPGPSRALGELSGEDLAAPRLVGVFSQGAELRAMAAAEEAEAAEAARRAELEQLRLREEREAAAEAERKAEQDRIAREQAAAAEAASRTAAASDPASAGPSAAQWHALRQCESGNDYQAVSRNQLYFGAYQFYQGTWDNTARSAGRTDLVGVRPDQASPADQDALAAALYRSRGHRPWPHCGSHLR